MIKSVLLSLLLLSNALLAVQVPTSHNLPTHPKVKQPWFTGPLLAPSAVTIPPGHYNIEPYIFSVVNIGSYQSNWKSDSSMNFYNNYLQPSIQIGLNSFSDFEFYPTLYYNYTQDESSVQLGDLPIYFDFQLFSTKRSLIEWNTALKLSLKAAIPIGKYDRLDPKKLLTDVGGLGNWQPGVALTWGNIFYIGNDRFVTWRTGFQYTYSNPVRVKNLNVYGGGEGTHGTVYPPQNFNLDTAIEINMNQNWVFAMDAVMNINTKSRFSGTTSISNTSPFSIVFSLAPAIEYNWSAQLGIIAGSWFTVAGKNATQFASGVIALNYYH